VLAPVLTVWRTPLSPTGGITESGEAPSGGTGRGGITITGGGEGVGVGTGTGTGLLTGAQALAAPISAITPPSRTFCRTVFVIATYPSLIPAGSACRRIAPS
jgi:hypothetical protein